MTDDDELIDDGPPEDYVSAETLTALRRSGVAVTPELVIRLATDPRALLPDLDAATTVALDAATEIGEGVPDDALGDVSRASLADAAGIAVLAGYALGRVLLGTANRALHWSRSPDDVDALLMTQEIAIEDIALPKAWVGPSGLIIDRVTVAAGCGPGDEPMASLAAMCFDTGVCMAALEHDCAAG